LPTPPQPTHTTTRRESAGSVTRRLRAREQRLGEQLGVGGSAQAVAQVRQRDGRQAGVARDRGDVMTVQLGARAQRSAARGERARRRQCAERRRVGQLRESTVEVARSAG
jgi:hypothetical protein